MNYAGGGGRRRIEEEEEDGCREMPADYLQLVATLA
jgi:hypothetical protein